MLRTRLLVRSLLRGAVLPDVAHAVSTIMDAVPRVVALGGRYLDANERVARRLVGRAVPDRQFYLAALLIMARLATKSSDQYSALSVLAARALYAIGYLRAKQRGATGAGAPFLDDGAWQRGLLHGKSVLVVPFEHWTGAGSPGGRATILRGGHALVLSSEAQRLEAAAMRERFERFVRMPLCDARTWSGLRALATRLEHGAMPRRLYVPRRWAGVAKDARALYEGRAYDGEACRVQCRRLRPTVEGFATAQTLFDVSTMPPCLASAHLWYMRDAGAARDVRAPVPLPRRRPPHAVRLFHAGVLMTVAANKEPAADAIMAMRERVVERRYERHLHASEVRSQRGNVENMLRTGKYYALGCNSVAECGLCPFGGGDVTTDADIEALVAPYAVDERHSLALRVRVASGEASGAYPRQRCARFVAMVSDTPAQYARVSPVSMMKQLSGVVVVHQTAKRVRRV